MGNCLTTALTVQTNHVPVSRTLHPIQSLDANQSSSATQKSTTHPPQREQLKRVQREQGV